MSRVALIILDGFGFSTATKNNAIAASKIPNFNYLLTHYPHTLLQASGSHVGLPDGFMGNSEVGHRTIGAGEILKEPLSILLDAIADKSFFSNTILIKSLNKLPPTNTLHVIGLLSDAGVHSHEAVLYALLQAAIQQEIKSIVIHCILDGRDVAPKSALYYLDKLQAFIEQYPSIRIGSISGRWYAMDRDNNMERTTSYFTMLTQAQPSQFATYKQAIDYYYSQGITDEFIPPLSLEKKAIIQPADGIIWFNYRPDRSRQILDLFISKLQLTFLLTLVQLSDTNTFFMFTKPSAHEPLMDWFYKKGITSFSLAETEKYAHVTYFFRCGREQPYNTQEQLLIPSIKAASYAHIPCMSADAITNAVVHSLQTDPKDFYLINYANADMVGHTGDFNATVQAIECLDKQLGILYNEIVLQRNEIMIITADHGNAEEMFDEVTGQPKTSHTTNPVPFIYINNNDKDRTLTLHELSDIKKFIQGLNF